MKKRTLLTSLAIGLALPGALSLLSACSRETPPFSSIDVTGAEYAKDFALPDQNGQLRHLQDFAGKVVLVFFGYTQCPDVCPTTLTDLVQAKKALGKDGERLQVVFVTVDPERDTPALLKAYMENFDPSFLALVPSLQQLPAVAQAFKIYYKKVPGVTAGSYTMDHSAGSYIYDPQGRLRLFARYGSPSEGLVADLRQLLAQSS